MDTEEKSVRPKTEPFPITGTDVMQIKQIGDCSLAKKWGKGLQANSFIGYKDIRKRRRIKLDYLIDTFLTLTGPAMETKRLLDNFNFTLPTITAYGENVVKQAKNKYFIQEYMKVITSGYEYKARFSVKMRKMYPKSGLLIKMFSDLVCLIIEEIAIANDNSRYAECLAYSEILGHLLTLSHHMDEGLMYLSTRKHLSIIYFQITLNACKMLLNVDHPNNCSCTESYKLVHKYYDTKISRVVKIIFSEYQKASDGTNYGCIGRDILNSEIPSDLVDRYKFTLQSQAVESGLLHFDAEGLQLKSLEFKFDNMVNGPSVLNHFMLSINIDQPLPHFFDAIWIHFFRPKYYFQHLAEKLSVKNTGLEDECYSVIKSITDFTNIMGRMSVPMKQIMPAVVEYHVKTLELFSLFGNPEQQERCGYDLEHVNWRAPEYDFSFLHKHVAFIKLKAFTANQVKRFEQLSHPIEDYEEAIRVIEDGKYTEDCDSCEHCSILYNKFEAVRHLTMLFYEKNFRRAAEQGKRVRKHEMKLKLAKAFFDRNYKDMDVMCHCMNFIMDTLESDIKIDAEQNRTVDAVTWLNRVRRVLQCRELLEKLCSRSSPTTETEIKSDDRTPEAIAKEFEESTAVPKKKNSKPTKHSKTKQKSESAESGQSDESKLSESMQEEDIEKSLSSIKDEDVDHGPSGKKSPGHETRSPKNTISVDDARSPKKTLSVDDARSPKKTLSVGDASSPKKTLGVGDASSPKKTLGVGDASSPKKTLGVGDASSPKKTLGVGDASSPKKTLGVDDARSPKKTLSVGDASSPKKTLSGDNDNSSEKALKSDVGEKGATGGVAKEGATGGVAKEGATRSAANIYPLQQSHKINVLIEESLNDPTIGPNQEYLDSCGYSTDQYVPSYEKIDFKEECHRLNMINYKLNEREVVMNERLPDMVIRCMEGLTAELMKDPKRKKPCANSENVGTAMDRMRTYFKENRDKENSLESFNSLSASLKDAHELLGIDKFNLFRDAK